MRNKEPLVWAARGEERVQRAAEDSKPPGHGQPSLESARPEWPRKLGRSRGRRVLPRAFPPRLPRTPPRGRGAPRRRGAARGARARTRAPAGLQLGWVTAQRPAAPPPGPAPGPDGHPAPGGRSPLRGPARGGLRGLHAATPRLRAPTREPAAPNGRPCTSCLKHGGDRAPAAPAARTQPRGDGGPGTREAAARRPVSPCPASPCRRPGPRRTGSPSVPDPRPAYRSQLHAVRLPRFASSRLLASSPPRLQKKKKKKKKKIAWGKV